MFLGSIFELFLLEMPSTVTLILPQIPHVLHQVLRIVVEFLAEVLELLHILLVFGLLGTLHLGLPVQFEEHHLRDLWEVGLVPAENFQFPPNLHHGRPRWTWTVFHLHLERREDRHLWSVPFWHHSQIEH